MKNIKFKITFGIILIFLFALIEYKYINETTRYEISNLTRSTLTKIQHNEEDSDKIKDIVVEQNFIANYDDFEYIYIDFYRNTGHYNVNSIINIKLIESETGKIVAEENITGKNLQYSRSYKFKFDRQKESKNKEYKTTLKYDNDALYCPYFQTGENYRSIYNNKEIKAQLHIVKGYFDKSSLIAITLLTLILEVIIYLIAIYVIDKPDLKEEKAFLLIVPLFCVLMSLSIPLGRGHDEPVHFNREYGIINGQVIVENNVVEIPKIFSKLFVHIFNDNLEVNQCYNNTFDYIDKEIDYNETEKANISTAAIYHPVQYISTTIGLAIAKIITTNPVIFIFMGRLSNIIISILLLYGAIKIMPFGKKILLLLSIIPISIEGFCTLSPDGLTISICYLFIAYVLNLAFNQDIKMLNTKHKFVILLLSVIIACCKIVYLPVVLLTLLIPKDKYGDKKEKIKSEILVFTISLIINVVWLIFSLNIMSSRSGETDGQIMAAIKNPINFGQMILYTISQNFDMYLLTAFGDKLEWGEEVKNSMFIILLIGLTMLTTILDSSIKGKFSKKQKVLIGIIILLILGLIFCSLYAQWTQKESFEIQGIQGRYFIPILPLILLLLGDVDIKGETIERKLTKTITLYGLIITVITILTIIISHM